MNKLTINVPKGIEFLNQWNEFNIPDHPCILNKQITGCGFTQWALSNNQNVILCSPRRLLLENKVDQFMEEVNNGKTFPFDLFYAKNDYEKYLEIDKNINKDSKSVKPINLNEDFIKMYNLSYKQKVKDFVLGCQFNNKYCKILVTYDSFRKVKEALKELEIFNQFKVYIDEFQVIFTDSSFKSDTELEFVDHLQGSTNICYVSATPMLEEYLNMLDEFNKLPYYELDWEVEDPTRVTRPNIKACPCTKIMRKAYEIVGKYKNNLWKDSDSNTKKFYNRATGLLEEVQSKEVVIFMNSVKNICDIIKHHNLKPDECNILCADTEENNEKLCKAFNIKKTRIVGKVPKKSEMHNNKMFTFCTRTVYLGADFYSTNARSFVFSDANTKCLAVDISLDLPQILGRQRLEENPWKNEVVFYYYSTRKDKNQTVDEFRSEILRKQNATNKLLSLYDKADSEEKSFLIEKYELCAKVQNYDKDYVSVNRHNGCNPTPVFNNLVMVSELRSFQVAQMDYGNLYLVRNSLSKRFGIPESAIVSDLLIQFDGESGFISKMKFLCNLKESNAVMNELLNRIDGYYSNYYRTLGPERIKSLSYRRDNLEKEISTIMNNQTIDVSESIYNEFKVGNKYPKSYIKEILKTLYEKLGFKKTAKATDLEEYFEIRAINYMYDGSKTHGFEILKKK